MKAFLVLACWLVFILTNYGQEAKKSIIIVDTGEYKENKEEGIGFILETALSEDFNIITRDQIKGQLDPNSELMQQIVLLTQPSRKNIYSGLSESEINAFKRVVLNADVILLPFRVIQRTITKVNGSGIIKLIGEIWVIDMKTGKINRFKIETKERFEVNSKPDRPSFLEFNEALVNKVKKKIK